MAFHLREKPIVAFLGGSALNTLVVGVGRNAITVCSKSCWRGTKLLLILPKDHLSSNRKIVLIRSADGCGLARMPTVNRGEHKTVLHGCGKILKV